MERISATLPTYRDLGFDAISLADHFTDDRGTKGIWFELWSLLTAVAMATSRGRLQTLVAQIPRSATRAVRTQALTADHISGGRLDLGLGIGLEIDPTYRMMGIENWSAKERATRPLKGELQYYESEEIFAGMVRKVMALGMSEVVLTYPRLAHQVNFERIARNVLPDLKTAQVSGRD